MSHSNDVPALEDRSADNAVWIDSLKREDPQDVANQLADLSLHDLRSILFKLPDEQVAAVIGEFGPEIQVKLFEAIRLPRLSGILEEMFLDDAADILGHLSSGRLNEILKNLPPETARKIIDILRYPEDSAGGIMNPDFAALREDSTLQEAIEALRSEQFAGQEGLFYVYVTDEEGRLRGVLRTRDLLFNAPEKRLHDLMIRDVRCVSVHADQEEIANIFRENPFPALPVVDDFQKLCGVVTSDDVMDVMEEEATEDMQRMIGLSGEEMLDTPWQTSFQRRLPWLYVNLATAILAGWVVSLFESTIDKFAILAVFLPIIASQGGNVGMQTLTIIVRSMALGEMEGRRKRRILGKEVLVSLLTGLATGVVIGLIGYVWRGDLVLGVVACVSMILNVVAAAAAGVLIPLGLKTLKIDPALASSIMLTTVTDVVGFFLFLGMATLGFTMFPPG